jgi:hypothetical protein
MWFNWVAFGDACLQLGFEPQIWQAHLRAILLGLFNDGVFRGRFTVTRFPATPPASKPCATTYAT